MLSEGMWMEIYFETLHKSKDQRGKSRFPRIRAKKITGFFLAHFRLNTQRLPAILKRIQHIWCNSSLYDSFKRKKATWMISMIYTKIKYERCVLFCLFGFFSPAVTYKYFFSALHCTQIWSHRDKARFNTMESWLGWGMCLNEPVLQRSYKVKDSGSYTFELESIFMKIWNLLRIFQEADMWNEE